MTRRRACCSFSSVRPIKPGSWGFSSCSRAYFRARLVGLASQPVAGRRRSPHEGAALVGRRTLGPAPLKPSRLSAALAPMAKTGPMLIESNVRFNRRRKRHEVAASRPGTRPARRRKPWRRSRSRCRCDSRNKRSAEASRQACVPGSPSASWICSKSRKFIPRPRMKPARPSSARPTPPPGRTGCGRSPARSPPVWRAR